jgi:hypothetical protein
MYSWPSILPRADLACVNAHRHDWSWRWPEWRCSGWLDPLKPARLARRAFSNAHATNAFN